MSPAIRNLPCACMISAYFQKGEQLAGEESARLKPRRRPLFCKRKGKCYGSRPTQGHERTYGRKTVMERLTDSGELLKETGCLWFLLPFLFFGRSLCHRNTLRQVETPRGDVTMEIGSAHIDPDDQRQRQRATWRTERKRQGLSKKKKSGVAIGCLLFSNAANGALFYPVHRSTKRSASMARPHLEDVTVDRKEAEKERERREERERLSPLSSF